MSIHPLAGQQAPRNMLVDIPLLVASYYTISPDPANPDHAVSFGTSGHRGSSLKSSFNEAHILAICQAISEIRHQKRTVGPLFLGMDTHALSRPAFMTAVEVFAANDITVIIDQDLKYTPTPVISHAILKHNSVSGNAKADGVIITPSHNPPEDGGIKYNTPTGGPADSELTKSIETMANEILAEGLKRVKRITFSRALTLSNVIKHDYITPYISDLENIVDMQAIGSSGLRIGVDPLGGSGIDYWEPLAEKYGLNIKVVNDSVDPAFSFMSVDRDGKIRMDCSSPYAMAGLLKLKNDFDIAFGNDPDYDRHGIITPAGLMNPNHYLAVAVKHLFSTRSGWEEKTAVGKTLVSGSMIDRVAAMLNRKVIEVPVGFKWFVEGLYAGSLGFAGEESAGASFLRKDGMVWSTDKDGIIMHLLAAEITALTGKTPQEHYELLTEQFGSPFYSRIDAPVSPKQKELLRNMTPDMVKKDRLAGENITAIMTKAPGNNAPIGGLKVTAPNGWFAARPSGTENIYKIYAESFSGESHLQRIMEEAKELVNDVLRDA